MMLTKSLLLLAMLLVAANGSEIYASVYDGAGCSTNSNLGSFKMTLDTCTQIPFSPISGYLYAKTTLSGTDYSTTFSLESDCTASQGVNPNPVTEVIDTCKDLSIYIVNSWIAHSEKFGNAYDSSATVTLDCTTTTTSAVTNTAGANDVAACITATSQPTSEPTSEPSSDPTADPSESPITAPISTTCFHLKKAYQQSNCCNQTTTQSATFDNLNLTCGDLRSSYKGSQCCSADLGKNATLN